LRLWWCHLEPPNVNVTYSMRKAYTKVNLNTTKVGSAEVPANACKVMT
jgi:hypothetical protein